MKTCPNCGVQINDDCLFCTECGKPIPQGSLCPHCGASVNDGDIFCQNCGKKVDECQSIDGVGSIQQKCPHCGSPVNDSCMFCENCGKKLVETQVEKLHAEFTQGENNYKDAPIVQSSEPNQPIISTPSISANPAPEVSVSSSDAYQEPKRNNIMLIIIIVFLTLIICGVGGYFYYDKVYLPEKIDREAPRCYSMANVIVLRSSRSAGADFNKVASLPYGTELITYENDNEWARVKVNSPNGEKQEGFVASAYILNKADFFLLNSIFGNQDSKEVIITTKCRKALLDYFKERHYIGKIDEQMRIDAGISTVPNSENQWQVFTKPKEAKPNSVFFKRLFNKSSQFTDFAVLITNIGTKERKLICFYFDDDETPHLLEEQNAPSDGFIVDINYEYDYYSGNRELNIRYSY